MRRALAAAGVIASGLLFGALTTFSTPLQARRFALEQGAVTEPTQARVLATNKTSTLEKELNEAAETGFRFSAVMGGETAMGGNEVVAIVTRVGTSARYLLQTAGDLENVNDGKGASGGRGRLVSNIEVRRYSKVSLVGRKSLSFSSAIRKPRSVVTTG